MEILYTVLTIIIGPIVGVIVYAFIERKRKAKKENAKAECSTFLSPCVNQSGSTALIQRKFTIGYYRAGRLMDQLEKAGVVGTAIGSAPRAVLIQDEYSLNKLLNSLRL